MDLPHVVMKALDVCSKLKASNLKLEAAKAAAKKRNNEAAKAAEAKFQSMVSELEAKQTEMLEPARKALEGRKQLLETWVASIFAKSEEDVNSHEQRYYEIRDSFESMVGEMVTLSFDQFTRMPKDVVPLPTDETLLKELDECLEVVMAVEKDVKETNTPSVPEQKASPMEAPVVSVQKTPEQEASSTPAVPAELVAEPKTLQQASQGNRPPADVNVIPVVVVGDGSEKTINAATQLLQRQDTSQLQRANTAELEEQELMKDAVRQPDGTFLYRTKRGKLETLEERQKRLAHNSYVAFSRSFEGLLADLQVFI